MLPNRRVRIISPATGPLIQIKPNRDMQPTLCSAITAFGRDGLNEQLHPAAPHHLPIFITSPGETDVLMVVMGIFLVGSVLYVGTLYWRLHSLPERMAHKSQKLQFKIVAVLGLLSLFTHIHVFWVIGLFLAMIDIPDFGTPLRSIADSVKEIAGTARGEPAALDSKESKLSAFAGGADSKPASLLKQREHSDV